MSIKTFFRRWFDVLDRQGWVGRWFSRLLPSLVVLWIVRVIFGLNSAWTGLPLILGMGSVALLGTTLLWRAATRRLLWRVRNRLMVTFLLLGLAPILLFSALTFIGGYLFAGQYATYTALRAIDEAANQVRNQAAGLAILSLMRAVPTERPVVNGQQNVADGVSLAILSGNVWQDLPGNKSTRSPFSGKVTPTWLRSGFQGIVELDGQLYLCSEMQVDLETRSALVLGAMPLTSQALQTMAAGLGPITITAATFGGRQARERPDGQAKKKADAGNQKETSDAADPDSVDTGASQSSSAPFHRITGGTLAPAKFLFDTRVFFTAPLVVKNWGNGASEQALVLVISRPTLLYAQLFASSADVGKFVRIVLIATAATFAVIELIALMMAIGLARTITRSVAELYKGTVEVDRGNFGYRVPTGRHDQLGALAKSFNTMTASMVELLVQQREKQRLESELAIAQDVQRNLFPVSPMMRGGLEVHAVCVPARTVSGDYFDFFGEGGQFCLALGDISGKGMSAALLMASLHSAVRSLGLSAEAAANGTPSSARLFSLLNQQLIQSTQPERYATLFLSFFDWQRCQLTYTNGGHLAPWLLSTDGTHRSLDRGGPVVGLLNGLVYDETTLDFSDGDLLVAYSDGLTEAENEHGEFGEARLLALVSENRGLPLKELAALTIQGVQTWIGKQEQVDDMTILFARLNSRGCADRPPRAV